jgi:hypothetical protein
MDVEPTLERRFLGVVEVDSGTLLVGDPGYCLPRAKDGKPGIDYESIIGAGDEPASYLAGKPVILLGAFGGDGTFPVFGEIDEYGELFRVTIEFVEPDDGDDEDGDIDAGEQVPMQSPGGPLRGALGAMGGRRAGVLRGLPDFRCPRLDLPASGVILPFRASGATGRTCRAGGVPRPAAARPRSVRLACRFRVATHVVPEGHRVRHPRCPKCGRRLAYRADGSNAWHLHVDDARFRLNVVR